jgi:hypothetical protein
MRSLLRLLAIGAAALLSSALTGCVTVAPYQRGLLTRPSMSTDFEGSESAFRAHVHDSREGSTGGMGSTGGGCGCN